MVISTSLQARATDDAVERGRTGLMQMSGSAAAVASGAPRTAGADHLAGHDADIIIALARGGADPAAAVDDAPLWKSMSAVQAGRVMDAPWLVWALNSATGVHQITADLTEVTRLLKQQR